MKTRKTILALVLASSAAAISFGAAAAGLQGYGGSDRWNPDYSAGTLPNKSATAAQATGMAIPAYGSVSEDGRYVWKNPNKGWEARGHNYVFAAGKLDHAPDCLPYNMPKPIGAAVPAVKSST